MKIEYLFLMIWAIVGCKHETQEQYLLLGAWDSRDQSGLKLIFSENTLKEVYPDRTLQWRYTLKGDTLILLNANTEIQKHIIGKLTDKKLKLKPEKFNQVDIPLMNHVEFFKE
jgi:hypothetical protein